MKRTRLTNEKKLKIIDEVRGNIINRSEAMEKYNISRATLYEILRNEESIKESGTSFEMKEKKAKANSRPYDKMLEESLIEWLRQTKKLGGPITGPLIKQKALNIYDKLEAEAQNRDLVLPKGRNRKFVASAGWLDRFKKRHGIRLMAKEDIFPSDTEGAALSQDESKESSTSSEGAVRFPVTEAIFFEEETEESFTSAENAVQCLNGLLSWLETQKEIDISDEDLIVVRRLRKLVLGHVSLESRAEDIFKNL